MRGPLDLRATDLVAVHMPPGQAWLPVLAAAWDAQAAVLPVDHRLPRDAATELVDRAAPTASFDATGGFERMPSGAPVDPDVRLVMATSGTAGTAKLVELTAAALESALLTSSERLGAGPGAGDPWYCCLPLAHMGGMLVALRHAVLGVPVEVAVGFDVHGVARAAAAGSRFVSLVPTALGRLAAADESLTALLRELRAVLVGGAGLDPRIRARFSEQTGVPAVHTYGLTETCGGAVYDGVPLTGVEMRIEASTGQVLLRSPSVMKGYRGDPQATAAAFDPDGWFRTGDAGAIEAGRLVVNGRLDEVIVTGGEKVWPGAVEEAVRTHPGVVDAMAFGRPDPDWGERVVVLVVPRDAQSPPTVADLREWAAARLPRFALPKEVEMAAEIPRTPAGKARRRDPARGPGPAARESH